MPHKHLCHLVPFRHHHNVCETFIMEYNSVKRKQSHRLAEQDDAGLNKMFGIQRPWDIFCQLVFIVCFRPGFIYFFPVRLYFFFPAVFFFDLGTLINHVLAI